MKWQWDIPEVNSKRLHNYGKSPCLNSWVNPLVLTIINHDQLFSNHSQPILTIINHHQPSLNHQPSTIITHHYPDPSSTIIHHKTMPPNWRLHGDALPSGHALMRLKFSRASMEIAPSPDGPGRIETSQSGDEQKKMHGRRISKGCLAIINDF